MENHTQFWEGSFSGRVVGSKGGSKMTAGFDSETTQEWKSTEKANMSCQICQQQNRGKCWKKKFEME